MSVTDFFMRVYLDLQTHPNRVYYLLIAISLDLFMVAMLLSRHNHLIRYAALFVMASSTFVAYLNATQYFGSLNSQSVIANYMLNLSVQFLAAFIIPPLVDLWQKHKQYGRAILLAFLLALFSGFLIYQRITLIDPIAPALKRMGLEGYLVKDFLLNFGIELLAGALSSLLVLIVIFLIGKIVFGVFQQAEFSSQAGAMFATLFAFLLVRQIILSVTRMDNNIIQDFMITFYSMVATLIIFSPFVTEIQFVFPIVLVVVIGVSALLLIHMNSLGQAISLGVHGEFIGAIVFAALIENEWLHDRSRLTSGREAH